MCYATLYKIYSNTSTCFYLVIFLKEPNLKIEKLIALQKNKKQYQTIENPKILNFFNSPPSRSPATLSAYPVQIHHLD